MVQSHVVRLAYVSSAFLNPKPFPEGGIDRLKNHVLLCL